jgi:hypothetical protein
MEQSEAQTVFDDEEIRVVWHPGNADFVLITFGDLITPVVGNRCFADGPVGKACIPCIGIIAKGPNWFPRESLLAASQIIIPLLRPYESRITYGGSMGGYAAIKFSRLFDATEVIALCPQWSIDPAECDGKDAGWIDYFTDSMAGMGIRNEDISGAVFVFADLLHCQDDFHCRMIRGVCSAATLINVPLVGHHVTGVFAGTQNLLHLIEACRRRDRSELLKLVRGLRKDSHFRWDILVRKSIARYPRIICSILAERSLTDPEAIRLGGKYLFHAVDGFTKSGNRKGAIDCIEFFRGGLLDPQAQLMAAAVLSRLTRRETRIMTHQDTTLVYDFLQRVAVHTAPGQEPTAVQRPVQLHVVGGSASLCVDAAGNRIYLWLNGRGVLADFFEWQLAETPPRFDIRPSPGGTFTLSHAGKFFTAEPGGRFICDRDAAEAWERFRMN